MSSRDGAASSPAPALLRPLARLAEPAYLAELARRNRRFDRGEGVTRLDRRVISVGNISVGGVGKTPMVMTIVAWLLEEGVRPCIAMRGYRSQMIAAGESDEAMLYRERFGDVPVVAQADRLAGLRRLFAQERVGQGRERVGQDCILPALHSDTVSPEDAGLQGRRVTNLPHCVPPHCVVLDDGFQHRRIARDLDIVLLDASRDPFADRALPAGWLREPVSSLARADAVVLTHAEAAGPEAVARISARVAEVCGSEPIAVTRHQWQRLRVIHADGAERPAWLVGKRVVAGCAIGNAEAFVRAAREAVGEERPARLERDDGGADLSQQRSVARPGVPSRSRGEVSGELVLRDHDPWGERAVSRLLALARERNAEAIVVTAKDWTKLSRVERLRWPAPVVVAELGIGFARGERELREMVLAAKEPRAQARGTEGAK